MIICLGEVLTKQELAQMQSTLEREAFLDGARTAGWHARSVKHNLQVQASAPVAALQLEVVDALRRHPVFALAARPRRIAPVLFSRYEQGMEYGDHVDDAIMGGDDMLRTDIAVTLFLSKPEDYVGGELTLDTADGEQQFKLPAGSAVLYPASTLHRVETVTQGHRLAAVTWVQSLIRDAQKRELLFDLESVRRRLFEREGSSADFNLLSKGLANLIRMWADL